MSMSVTEAVTSRRSIRAFTDQPVDPAVVRRILTDAARAASGTNIQPWTVHVLHGGARDALVEAVQAAFDAGDSSGDDVYYPAEFIEPYKSRRRKIGWDMYGLVGIEKGDYEGAAAQARRNFQFFDAPVGMIFTLHETMRSGGWLDLGLFLANIMSLAREEGLHTCPQAAWQEFSHVIHRHLELPADQVVTVGMALGHEDSTHPINALRTERAPLDEYAVFHE